MKKVRPWKIVSVLVFLVQWGVFFQAGGAAAGPPELKNLGNGVCQQRNGLMWQMGASEKFSSGEEARAYAEGLELGGFGDWRLPTKDELYYLCDIFELKLEGDCSIKPKGSYWSDNGRIQPGEWEAYPLCGGSEYKYLKRKNGRVRAVRP